MLNLTVNSMLDGDAIQSIEVSEKTKDTWKLQADTEPVKKEVDGLMTWPNTSIAAGDQGGIKAAGERSYNATYGRNRKSSSNYSTSGRKNYCRH
jgi:hypothetical protein